MTNRFEILPGGLAVIYINGRRREHATLIDAADLPRVAALNGCWYAQHRRWTWYAAISLKEPGKPKRTIRLHRYIMDPPDDMEVDHADHDGLNNTRTNLSIVEPDENKQSAREWGEGRDIGERWYEAGCAVDPFDLSLEFI